MMTDRINELAALATVGIEDEFGHWVGSELSKEKFAELIIRECIAQAHSVADIRGANDDMIFGADTAAMLISRHFGIEELPDCKHDWYSARNPVVQNGSVCVICGAVDARSPKELSND
jgi:hypothetical protein